MPVVVKSRTLITGLLCLGQRWRPIQVGADGVMCDSANTSRIVSSCASKKYEELEIPTSPIRMFLVRVMVAKVIKWERMLQNLRAVPTVQNDSNWTCKIWVRD